MITRTYRGRSLEELLPKVRAELGPDAVIVRQREGLTGGIAGFFQRKLVEIEAQAPESGAPSIDVRDDTPATPDFLGELTRAPAAAAGFVPAEPFGPAEPLGAAAPEGAAGEPDFVPLELGEVVDDDAWSGWRDPAPAPAVGPFVTEQVSELPEPAPAPLPVPIERAPLPGAWTEEAAALRDALVARGVDAPLAEEIVEETITHLVPLRSDARLKPLLVTALARRIPVAPLGGLRGRVVAFVGAGGSGKTHCTARLAGAYAAADRMPVACVSLGARDGGSELALMLAPSGVPMHAASAGDEAARGIEHLRDRALVLVDTPAVSPRAKADLRGLQGELRALGADDILLTLPATTSAGAARELVAAGRRVGASGMVLTHADETEHFGPALGVAMESGLPFAYVGEARALRPAAAEELAGALVGASRGGSGRR